MHELSGGACTQPEMSPEVGELAVIAMREFEAVCRILAQVNAATEFARTLTRHLTVPRLPIPEWLAVDVTAARRSVRRTHGMAAHLRAFRGTAVQIEAFLRAIRPLTTIERTLVLRPGTLEAAWIEFRDAWCGLRRAERRARRARTDATRAGARQVVAQATARLDRAMETLLRRRGFVSARAARAYVARRQVARRRGEKLFAERYLALEPDVLGETDHAESRARRDSLHPRSWPRDQEPAIAARERLQAFRLALHEIGAGRQRIRFQGSYRSAACRRGLLFADPQDLCLPDFRRWLRQRTLAHWIAILDGDDPADGTLERGERDHWTPRERLLREYLNQKTLAKETALLLGTTAGAVRTAASRLRAADRGKPKKRYTVRALSHLT